MFATLSQYKKSIYLYSNMKSSTSNTNSKYRLSENEGSNENENIKTEISDYLEDVNILILTLIVFE